MAADKVNLTNLNAALTRFQQNRPVDEQPRAQASHKARAADQPVQDRFEKSAAAETFAHMQATMDAGRAAVAQEPDVRQERIDEVKQKMLAGEVITPEVKERVSENLEQVMRLLDYFVN